MAVYELRDHDNDDCHDAYRPWLGFQDRMGAYAVRFLHQSEVVVVLMGDHAF